MRLTKKDKININNLLNEIFNINKDKPFKFSVYPSENKYEVN